jgi:hypothetical protein
MWPSRENSLDESASTALSKEDASPAEEVRRFLGFKMWMKEEKILSEVSISLLQKTKKK